MMNSWNELTYTGSEFHARKNYLLSERGTSATPPKWQVIDQNLTVVSIKTKYEKKNIIRVKITINSIFL